MIAFFVLFIMSCNQKPNPYVNWPPPMSLEWNDLQGYSYNDAGIHVKD